MKRIITLLLLSLLVVVGCRKDDDFGSDQGIRPVSFTVSVKYDQSKFPNMANKGAAKVTVNLENTATGAKITGVTDDNGELKLDAVMPGDYNITSELKMPKTDYEKMFGESTNYETVHFGGSQEKVKVNANISSTIMQISSGNIGDLVIKQYYYAGSDSKLGALFRDQFVEIHNNSSETIYADGLYIALIEGNVNNKGASYTLANGQYDWSQTAGGGAAANTNFVYAGSVIRVPGNGIQYPILPGKSIVIAQTAINHKAPFDGNDGKSVSIQNPELTVDLSKADFEVYLGDYAKGQGKNPYQWDIQNVMVPDMDIAFWANPVTDWILNLTHRPALAIFRASPEQINSWQKFANPKTPKGSLFLQIPKGLIIDGLDITDKEQLAPKDLPTDIDATRNFINQGGLGLADYTGMSLMRKTKETINGRVVLQDTNNSANDFVTVQANPRGYAQ
ncbi:DUF4876 domain-containing protein [Elizabethkingia sp. HX XZB]|jgi:hypothetical protein|uniref:DUF4876 domain-containing protein n=1 Tax=Elizabethkingia TaxID=308865 RepID=UPI000B3535AF|nr:MULTISPECIES: DUF4876 domain-containing protein [Elizabethkingia]MDR2228642.1 DUF4876 domain-containing protein [Flavobacteriaceae bacterium]MCL1670683.1 DUF4876 domain-containing protein [Elizabethkingia ursingii]MDX8566448.1 DUF4876 domain-containing protein [Elizabethkingia sp. HX XZB]NHQ65121.1 DUF4876 domain-containing protein [Elizabethkingia miricola]NHQ69651.1 DUF4876 domain-containing protein [Elizabethkingia miricola]